MILDRWQDRGSLWSPLVSAPDWQYSHIREETGWQHSHIASLNFKVYLKAFTDKITGGSSVQGIITKLKHFYITIVANVRFSDL